MKYRASLLESPIEGMDISIVEDTNKANQQNEHYDEYSMPSKDYRGEDDNVLAKGFNEENDQEDDEQLLHIDQQDFDVSQIHVGGALVVEDNQSQQNRVMVDQSIGIQMSLHNIIDIQSDRNKRNESMQMSIELPVNEDEGKVSLLTFIENLDDSQPQINH